MKQKLLAIACILLTLATIVLSCKTDGKNENPDEFTMGNYSRIDGSTSTDPLNLVVAANLLGLEYQWIFEYQWIESVGVKKVIFKDYHKLPSSFTGKFKCSQTNGAILNLIDNKTDLIIVARKMSTDEKQYADNERVSLIETPIALDALDFILNSQNSVNSLSVEQVQNIYLGNITNWRQVADM